MLLSDAPAPTPALPAINIWPAEVLARQLVAEDAFTRTGALGMALQKDAPIDACADALVRAAQLSLPDAQAAQMAAAALGCLKPELAPPAAAACLAAFAAVEQPNPVRIAAAHAMFRLRCLPPAAFDALCLMLLDADLNARKVALLAIKPFARAAAGAITGLVGRTPAERWSVEALLALIHSAGDDAHSRRTLDAFVMRSLAGAKLLPTGIAGYAALAQLNPKGSAIPALAQVASNTQDMEASKAALDALGEMGETARPAARQIAQMLTLANDPAHDELLCRTLVKLRAAFSDLPAAHIVQRVAQAPDRGAAACCMLLCLHPKEFAKAAAIVKDRFLVAGEALQQVLSLTYKTLTGTGLTGQGAAQGV